MMMVVMMMVLAEVTPERTNDEVMMVMVLTETEVVMMMVFPIEYLRHLHLVGGFSRPLLRHPGLIGFQGSDGIRHRIEQIPVAGRFGRLRRRRGLSGGDGRQGGSGAEKTRDSLVHVSSERVWTFPNLPREQSSATGNVPGRGTEIAVRIDFSD